jgi:hypothetical protein
MWWKMGRVLNWQMKYWPSGQMAHKTAKTTLTSFKSPCSPKAAKAHNLAFGVL